MAGDAEVNVAIVALIVSAIALIVAFSQFIVQLAGTADGYRRCAESVIDIWHVKRRRVFKWSEFRFETQYITPQVVLLSPAEFQAYAEEYGEVYLLSSAKLKEPVCKELDHTVHQDYYHLGKRRDRKKSARKDPIPRPTANSGTGDVEKANMMPARVNTFTKSPVRRRMRPESDPLVSWLRLLRELHQVSHSYWPQDCTQCSPAVWDTVDTGIIKTEYDALLPEDPKDDEDEDEWEQRVASNANMHRTDVAVIYRTWTWDFMPPEMARPLAEVNTGDIVVLALRMGMQWRALDPEFGKMQADGNGYNLSATDIKGLGVVLRFTAAGHHERFPRLIPSRAADKMLCGILPGDPYLVRMDFPMVDNNAKVQDIAAVDGVLSKIGVQDARRDAILRNAAPEITNDTITLLLPFLPLEGSTMASFAFPGWKCTPAVMHVYCFWEGRIALHRKLQERANNEKIGQGLKETLNCVLAKMDLLEQKYSNDWYSRWASSTCVRNTSGRRAKEEAIQSAREIFQWTTNYFIEHNFHHKTYGGLTEYVHLVAAHVSMADHAWVIAGEFLRHYSRDRAQPSLRRDYNITADHGHYFVFELYELGIHYVKYLNDQEHGVRQYLRNKGIPDRDGEEIEAAWWVMQLRGIVQNFSTHHHDNFVSTIIGDRLVPSSFYGNKSPLWIT